MHALAATGLVASLLSLGSVWAGDIAITRMGWKSGASSLEVDVTADASQKARTVYLVWDDADCGDDFLDWERGEVLGELPAGATSKTFSTLAGRYANAYRVFTFDPTETGDGYLASIQATGAQYFRFNDVRLSYQSTVWADYKWNDLTGQQRIVSAPSGFVVAHYIAGTAASGGPYAYACQDASGNWKNYGDTATKDRVAVTIDSYGDNYVGRFRINRNGVPIRDVAMTDAVAVSKRTQTSTSPLYVLAQDASTAARNAKADLYRFRTFTAGVPQLDLRPYVKDGVAGCLDRVSGTFFKSATATDFVAGTRLGLAALDVSPAMAKPGTAEVGIVAEGTYESPSLPGGAVSPLSGTTSILLRDGTFKYTGAAGEKGYYEGDISFGTTNLAASVFDITGDLTLTGKVESRGGFGSFVKTGPGTLRIPGTSSAEWYWYVRGALDADALKVFTKDEQSGSPMQGYTCVTLTEGRLVLGENGGRFRIVRSNGADVQIGRLTVDPANPNGQQEKEAVLEIAGGTTIITNWVNVGGKNGFVTTCPEKVPESGIRVTGGTLHCMGSLTLGRNKNVVPQQDAAGNYIAQRTKPFLEVLGGTLQLWNTGRIGFCDDPGADSRILVDKGRLYVCNANNTTGSGITLGQCSDGVATAARHCDITVRNGGTFDCTDFYINANAQNLTCDLKVVDGGIYRNNQIRKVNTKDDCALNMLFDGGVAEIRYAGYTTWINGDVSKVAVGTRGATFRSGSGCSANVLDYIQVPLVAETTYADEEPCGVTVTYNGSNKNAGFVFTQPNTYAGPTTIDKYGRLEFAGAGAFPASSDVILGQGGRLALTNAAHVVKSFTMGNKAPTDTTTSALSLLVGAPLTAGHFAAVGSGLVNLSLYSAPNVPLATAGTYALIQAPAADQAELRAAVARLTWSNAPEGLNARFAVTVDGDQATLAVTVGEDVVASTLHPAAGGTETVSSIADALDASGLFRLGTGTVAYTGAGETVSGLVNAAGASSATILNIANDLTLLDFITPQQGALFKTGPGVLNLMGTGTFNLGNVAVAYQNAMSQGIDADGNPPPSAILGAQVADGSLIIGVKDDPANAPHVLGMNGFGVGVRTVARDSGKMETAGLVEMNNGVLDVSYLYIGYYNGYDETTPEEGLFPTFRMNGGVVNISADLRIDQDWEGNQANSPVFELNDGTVTLGGDVHMGYQVANGRAGTVNTFRMNGGSFACKNLLVGNAAGASKVRAEFNGGDVHCYNITRGGGNATSTDKGYAEAVFNGTVFHLGRGRSLNGGIDVGHTDANKRINAAYVGKGGLIFDFDEWTAQWNDATQAGLRQKLLHDPNCEGEDGGFTLRNGAGSIIRAEANGSTFTGPVTVESGSFLGLDDRCDWFSGDYEGRRVICKPSACVSARAQLNTIGVLTLGEEAGTEPVVIDLCLPSGSKRGLVVTKTLNVLSPVTATFHRGGGWCVRDGVWIGTTDLLLYPADQDANVPLEMFVTNPGSPEVKMSFAKADVTSGDYAGYKKIVMTVTRDYSGGTAWTSTTAGGAWTDGANWAGGVPANGTNVLAQFTAAAGAAVNVNVDAPTTVGHIYLHGADAQKGYALAGQTVNLNNLSWNEAAGVVAVSGTHTIANNLVRDKAVTENGEGTGDGGRTGAIDVTALSNATLTVTGEIVPDAKREVHVNPKGKGGGRVVLDGPVTAGTGVTVESGTLEVKDFTKLNGARVLVGPGTLHYTGPEASTESPIGFKSGATNLTSIIRVDNKLTVNGAVTADGGNVGNVMKTGPGELVLNGTGDNRLGGVGYSPDWNKIVTWPDNGDSRVMTGAAFCLDEGTLTVGRPGQTILFGNAWTDIFIGSQPRGWSYAGNKVTLNMMGGMMKIGYLGLGHGMRRGADADMSDVCYVEFNQYGGIVTNQAIYMNYELTKYDSHIRSTFNLWGGRFVTAGYIRFGQSYNKTGKNEPSSTANIYPGAVWEFTRTADDRRGNVFIPYSGGTGDLGRYSNRAPDATLNLEGGTVENAYLLVLGQNGGRGEIHLNAGVLNCENIVHYPYAVMTSNSLRDQYRVYNVADGQACVYFNGAVFQPMGEMTQPKDVLKSALWNATLTNLTTAVVEAGGAKFDLSKLAADRYTIAQELTGGEGDGGLVKTGAKTLALAARSTYTGETVVEEGTLLIAKEAPAGEILPNSTVRVKAGATLAFEEGTQATVSKLVVDVAAGGGTVKNLKIAADGALHLENVTAEKLSGLVIPLTISETARVNLAGWKTYVNGEELEGNLRPIYRNGVLTLVLPDGTYITIR